MPPVRTILEELKNLLLPVFGERLQRVVLFGSVARGQETEDSDVDVLVEFQPGTVAGYLTMAAMQRELAILLGRRVDLRTPNELSRYFREDVLRQAEVIYEDSSSTEAAR